MLDSIRVGDAAKLPLPDRSVNLIMGSPPYLKARDYGIVNADGKKVCLRTAEAWVEWMIPITLESLRVATNLVVWVVCGEMRGNNYHPAPEGLIWEIYKNKLAHQFRPCYWIKNGMSGSGGPYWFRNRVEYLVAFKHRGAPDYADPCAVGAPPKYAPGGEFSHRTRDGSRVNEEPIKLDRSRRPDGTRRMKRYTPPEKANPGNVIHANVGGNHMGSDLAHRNEAPYPEALPSRFIQTHCPPGGVVCDPFCGSGTTLAVAKQLGRRYIGFDIRESQVELSQIRVDNVTPFLPLTA